MSTIKYFYESFIKKTIKPLFVLSILFLISCSSGDGNDVVAAFQYVPAIGGEFCHDADSNSELFENGSCKSVDIFIDIESPTGGMVWDAFFDSQLGITGSVINVSKGNPLACDFFKGLTDGREITAYDSGDIHSLISSAALIDPDTDTLCFTATSENLNVIRLSNGQALWRDEEPSLVGVWVDINNTDLVFKFDEQGADDFKGCEINKGEVTEIDGTFLPSDITKRIITEFTELKILRLAGDEVWQGDFVGKSSIKLTHQNGSSISLQREPDDNGVYNCS